MNPFALSRPREQADAFAAASQSGRYIAGGTTLVDLMREGVETPSHLVDINALPLRDVRVFEDRVEIGALARMSDVAAHPDIVRLYPVISQALLLSASAQLRNMASIAGNLLQRTRCTYFRDITSACNKRAPGTGCPARNGENRMHAILGTSMDCVATHPSDLAVALVALGARIRIASSAGERRIEVEHLYVLPGQTPQIENVLRPGELIVSVEVPSGAHAVHSGYLKVRDRQSYEFALISAAVALVVERGAVREARVAVGGVATRPWRLRDVEKALVGNAPTTESFTAAASLATQGADPLAHNAFKLELLPRTIVRALQSLGAGA
jgi:xanthine dehydrogenase YagS FAD-binding subunit